MANNKPSKPSVPEARFIVPDGLRGPDGQLRTVDGLKWGHAPGKPNADIQDTVAALTRLSRQGRGATFDPSFASAEPFRCLLCGDGDAV